MASESRLVLPPELFRPPGSASSTARNGWSGLGFTGPFEIFPAPEPSPDSPTSGRSGRPAGPESWILRWCWLILDRLDTS